MKNKIVHTHEVARQLYRFASHRAYLHRKVRVTGRVAFHELVPEAQQAWFELAQFVLAQGRHNLRDWQKRR